MVVFDFDKTLTDTDTLWGYYKAADRNSPLFITKRLFLVFCAILYKVKLISNTSLKQAGIYLFLKGKSKKFLQETAKVYAREIRLNKIHEDHFLTTPKEKRLIISASLEMYLKEVFPGEKVIGASLKFSKDKVISLDRNMYGEDKKIAFLRDGKRKIDCLYTDSYSDKPLMKLANKIFLVQMGEIISTIQHDQLSN